MSSEGKNEFKNNKKSKKNVKSGVQSLEFYITGEIYENPEFRTAVRQKRLPPCDGSQKVPLPEGSVPYIG